MRPIKTYEHGGVHPLTNKEFRQNERLQRKTERQHRPYEKADDTEELLDMLNNSEDVEERRLIISQIKRALGIAATGVAATKYFASPGMELSRIRRFIQGNQ